MEEINTLPSPVKHNPLSGLQYGAIRPLRISPPRCIARAGRSSTQLILHLDEDLIQHLGVMRGASLAAEVRDNCLASNRSCFRSIRMQTYVGTIPIRCATGAA